MVSFRYFVLLFVDTAKTYVETKSS